MGKQLKILIIDDDAAIREASREALKRVGHLVESADSATSGLALYRRYAFDVVLLDLRMPDHDGMEVLRSLKTQDPEAIVVIISAYGSVPMVVEAVKLGAFDFLPKPFTPDELRRVVARAQEQRLVLQDAALGREQLGRRPRRRPLVTASPAMGRIRDLLARVAPTDTTVLFTGESGTGKSLLARWLHDRSSRADRPFVGVDCSTLVPTLFESELFGHVRGAFTGAAGDRRGKFELSEGGTLFLDEVSNIPPEAQAKLLKAVEERAIYKVGGDRLIQVDVRLVAASNRDLDSAVAQGEFRRDLLYRLNVMHVHLPPLRERPEDIAPLAESLLEDFRRREETPARGFTRRAQERLQAHHWPGNARELRNVVERLAILATTPTIGPDQVERALGAGPPATPSTPGGRTLAEVEASHISRILEETGWHLSRSAEILGIDRKTLRNKIRRYDLGG